MLQEHKRIEKILQEFENSLGSGYVEETKRLEILEWNLKKHFFMEEKIIFSIYTLENKQHNNQNLLDEHQEILNLVEDIKQHKPNKREIIEELKNILKAHVIFEDNTFYPELEQGLSQTEKQDVVERVKAIISG